MTAPRTKTVSEFLACVSSGEWPDVFNPWLQSAPDDTAGNGPEKRLERLRLHVNRPAALILLGEAPSAQGCRISGIPFTAERHLLEGIVPGVVLPARASTRHIPWSEPSGTIVWRTLYNLGLADATVLWNAFPWHPHPANESFKNRTPTSDELLKGSAALRALMAAHPGADIVAVGRKAEQALTFLDVTAPVVRHPANGGATAFAQQLAAICVDKPRSRPQLTLR